MCVNPLMRIIPVGWRSRSIYKRKVYSRLECESLAVKDLLEVEKVTGLTFQCIAIPYDFHLTARYLGASYCDIYTAHIYITKDFKVCSLVYSFNTCFSINLLRRYILPSSIRHSTLATQKPSSNSHSENISGCTKAFQQLSKRHSSASHQLNFFARYLVFFKFSHYVTLPFFML